MYTRLRQVLVKRPDEVFAAADPVQFHYTGRPDLEAARHEHTGLVTLLQQSGAEVIFHDEPQPGRADALYVYDPAIVTERGAIVLRMGKAMRRGEEASMAQRLEQLGVPILYTLHGTAQAEGGDLLWLDRDTLAVGLGFRTNLEGLRQLREATANLGVEIIPVELPYYTGPTACLHLLSLISIVDERLAVVYPPLMSVPFWQRLQEQGFQFVEVPPEEFDTMGTNVLALSPRKCIMLEGNPITQARLEAAGCEVATYHGAEISLKCEGGPTCLTRPILRGA